MLLDVVEYGQAMGLDMSYGDHEDAPGQLELNFRFDRPIKTADNITTYRQICAAVDRKHGLIAPFMPKPFSGVSANGHHHHFTLWTTTATTSSTIRSGPAQLSDVARNFLGGMLDHFGALMCVGNPTVNSYCRMWDCGFWAARLQELGLAEPHLHGACGVRRPLRVPRRGLLLQPVPDGRVAAGGGPRRHPQRERSRRAADRATPMTCSAGDRHREVPEAPATRSARSIRTS